MFLEILLRVGVALFAAFGLICALQMLTRLLFGSDCLTGAVVVRSHEDAEELAELLHEARIVFGGCGTSGLVVLISTSLMDGTLGVGEECNDECLEILDCYGADCYLIDFEE